MSEPLKISHSLGELYFHPRKRISRVRLRSVLHSALDEFADAEEIPADVIHDTVRERHGARYGTPGYFLRIYRHRAALTQAALAERAGIRQHHISEMEHGKRPIGRTAAAKLSKILRCPRHRLL